MLLLALIQALLPGLPVEGQEKGEGWTECRTSETGRAIIRGRLVPLAEGMSGYRVIAWLEGEQITSRFGCRIEVHSPEPFEYRNLPPGDYELRYSHSGMGRDGRIPVRVRDDSLIVLDLPQFRDNPIEFCLRNPDCAQILTRKPRAERGVSEDLELSLLGHRLALVLISQAWEREEEEPWMACVPEEAPEGVISALREVYPHVSLISECEFRSVPDPSGPVPEKRWFDKATPRPAAVISVQGLNREPDGRIQLDVAYHVGPLWAAGWRCEIRRQNGVLFPEFCWMRWVS